MATFTLVLADESFSVARRPLILNCSLFDNHPELYDVDSYEVRSRVSHAQFEEFLSYLQTQQLPEISAENARAFSSLFQEFGVDAELPPMIDPIVLDRILALEEAVAHEISVSEFLYRDLPAQLMNFFTATAESIETSLTNFKGQLKLSVDTQFSEIRKQLSGQQLAIGELSSGIDRVRGHCTRLDEAIQLLKAEITDIRRSIPREFPFDNERPMEGIISYLGQKHTNLQDRGIVSVTSKSVAPGSSLESITDVNDSRSVFLSKNDPGQWVTWDFHEMKIIPTAYTIQSDRFKSWVLEGAVSGVAWTELDRQTGNSDLSKTRRTASFDIRRPVECRFVRLAQTGKSSAGDDQLALAGLEFFGSLIK